MNKQDGGSTPLATSPRTVLQDDSVVFRNAEQIQKQDAEQDNIRSDGQIPACRRAKQGWQMMSVWQDFHNIKGLEKGLLNL